MGCDIHFYVDVRQPDGSWKTADRWFPQLGPEELKEEGEEKQYLDTYEDVRKPDGSWDIDASGTRSFYSDRHYDVFSILADVRNGYGFAGVDTGEGFRPLSKPRGVPEDACPEYKAAATRWDVDGHSHSWCTVQELLDYNWLQTTKKRGVVGARAFIKWQQLGAPDSYSGDVRGSGVTMLTNEQMANRIDAVKCVEYPNIWSVYHALDDADFTQKHDLAGAYTQVEWEVPYYRAAATFLSEAMPKLWRLGKAEDVRCLFFFDN